MAAEELSEPNISLYLQGMSTYNTGLGRPYIYGILQNVAFAVLVQDGHNSFQRNKKRPL